eukprot:140273-Amphidinium_carterae.1
MAAIRKAKEEVRKNEHQEETPSRGVRVPERRHQLSLPTSSLQFEHNRLKAQTRSFSCLGKLALRSACDRPKRRHTRSAVTMLCTQVQIDDFLSRNPVDASAAAMFKVRHEQISVEGQGRSSEHGAH